MYPVFILRKCRTSALPFALVILPKPDRMESGTAGLKKSTGRLSHLPNLSMVSSVPFSILQRQNRSLRQSHTNASTPRSIFLEVWILFDPQERHTSLYKGQHRAFLFCSTTVKGIGQGITQMGTCRPFSNFRSFWTCSTFIKNLAISVFFMYY